MKRLIIAAMIVAAFSFVGAVTASADSMAAPAATSVTVSSDMNPDHAWVGKSTVDLLVNLGVPTYTDQRSSGETITYVTHQGVGSNTSVNVIRQFDVDSSGKITAVRDSQS
jgi:hypothetical protein